MDLDVYDKIETLQETDLLSEVDQMAPVVQKSYRDYALANAPTVDHKPAAERIKEMEGYALDVYEMGLTNSDVPYNQRRQVADKVLEITGVIDKGKGQTGGNTFIFSESFAEKFMNAAGKIQNSLRTVSDES